MTESTETNPEQAAQANILSQEEIVNSPEEELKQLKQSIEQLQQDIVIQNDLAVRAKAEAENVRRRSEREVSNASKFALERFSKELLIVIDSLEQALEQPANDDVSAAMKQGIELTYKLFLDTLKKFGVQQLVPIEALFNPEQHEAIVMQESKNHEPNTVINVVQKGYLLNGRLVRPARVVVSKGPAPTVDEIV